MDSTALSNTLVYLIFPLLAPILGGLIALRTAPSHQARSLIRHIAAGLVFAAAAVELVPVLLRNRQPAATIIGFALGLLLLLVVGRLFGGHYHGDGDETKNHAHTEKSHGTLSTLLAAIAVDVAVDGLLIGIGFSTGVMEGRLLTLALSVEALFIGMSLMCSVRQAGLTKARSLALSGLPGIVLAAMALVGAGLTGNLGGAAHQGVIAFGISALLYLVTEELLVEAHESPDEPVETVGFFLGFLLILTLAIV